MDLDGERFIEMGTLVRVCGESEDNAVKSASLNDLCKSYAPDLVRIALVDVGGERPLTS